MRKSHCRGIRKIFLLQQTRGYWSFNYHSSLDRSRYLIEHRKESRRPNSNDTRLHWQRPWRFRCEREDSRLLGIWARLWYGEKRRSHKTRVILQSHERYLWTGIWDSRTQDWARAEKGLRPGRCWQVRSHVGNQDDKEWVQSLVRSHGFSTSDLQ